MRRLILVLTVTLLVVIGSASALGAHPLGNATIAHHSGLAIGSELVEVDYVLDLAEIPSFQQKKVNSGPAGPRCAELGRALEITLDGQELDVVVGAAHIEFSPGQDGLDTTRIECVFQAGFEAAAGPRHLTYRDRNFERRDGWGEISVRGVGVVVDSTLPADSATDRLRSYPDDGTRMDVRTAEVRFENSSSAIQDADFALVASAVGPVDTPGRGVSPLLIAGGAAAVGLAAVALVLLLRSIGRGPLSLQT